MTVTLPTPNNSWMTQLVNSFGAQQPQRGQQMQGQPQQPQQQGVGYFPPAPTPVAGQQPGMFNGGSFLQALGNMPPNQAATNMYQPNVRLGG